MPLKCVILDCPGDCDVIFEFPIKPKTRERWIAALGFRIDGKLTEESGLCKSHFHPSLLNRGLKPLHFAIPTIFKTEPANGTTVHDSDLFGSKVEESVTSESIETPVTVSTLNIKPETSSVVEEPINILEQDVDVVSNSAAMSPEKINIIPNPLIITVPFEPNTIKIEVDNLECNVPDPLSIEHVDGLRLEDVRKESLKSVHNPENLSNELLEIQTQINEEKCLKQKIKKSNQQKKYKLVAKLKQRLEKLKMDEKKLIKLNDLYIKPELKVPKLIFDRFGIGEYDGLIYPREFKQFASEFYDISPDAYEYVRTSFCNVIPHPDAINRWKASAANEE